MSLAFLNPFQLLELNIISAQDLANVTRSMHTYAVAWVHLDRKLSTRVASHGRNNPTWNDKFVFRVDDEFLTSDTSPVMIEIYAVHWFKDVLVGRVRVLISDLVPSPSRRFRDQQHHGMRFVALQVWRPSGRPKGILNIGVAVLNSSMRSMPLYVQLSTLAVGCQNPYSPNHHPQQQQQQTNSEQDQRQDQQILPAAIAKPELRRSKSNTSSIHGVKTLKRTVSFRERLNSVINASDVACSAQEKNTKGSSSIRSSTVNASASNLHLAVANPGRKGEKGQVANKGLEVAAVISSIPATNRSKWEAKANLATLGPDASLANKKLAERQEVAVLSSRNPDTANKSKWVSSAASTLKTRNNSTAINKTKWMQLQRPVNNITEKSVLKNEALDFKMTNKPGKLYFTESELGPSRLEVAAAMAEKRKYQRQHNDRESSAWDGWSLVESEGLQSKLEKWRRELPPIYDRRKNLRSTLPLSSGNDNMESSGLRGKHRHSRIHTTDGALGGPGLFSCVGKICGFKCSIVCGKDSSALQR